MTKDISTITASPRLIEIASRDVQYIHFYFVDKTDINIKSKGQKTSKCNPLNRQRQYKSESSLEKSSLMLTNLTMLTLTFSRLSQAKSDPVDVEVANWQCSWRF